jgi:hypothetical protein
MERAMSQYDQLREYHLRPAHKVIDAQKAEIARLREELDAIGPENDIYDDDEESSDWYVPCGICREEIFWDDTPNPRCLPYCA